ncbi:hypothetical protein MMC06_004492 [Schaereria dolodes]|nr:hypothetical protein [Schaereria dolodes]
MAKVTSSIQPRRALVTLHQLKSYNFLGGTRIGQAPIDFTLSKREAFIHYYFDLLQKRGYVFPFGIEDLNKLHNHFFPENAVALTEPVIDNETGCIVGGTVLNGDLRRYFDSMRRHAYVIYTAYFKRENYSTEAYDMSTQQLLNARQWALTDDTPWYRNEDVEAFWLQSENKPAPFLPQEIPLDFTVLMIGEG